MSRAKRRTPRAAPKPPPVFAAALQRNRAAAAAFASSSPSCRREYLEWIIAAKRDETKQRRIGQAIGWLAEGKRLNWKYER
jgi:uncharacterized protein YdeI (YjbR/CyaY-like superfamily)